MELNLEELAEAMIYFSAVQCQFLAENCIVALENRNHHTGVTMEISGDYPQTMNLNWVTKVNTQGYKERKKFTEKGAEAMSFFLAINLTDYEVVEESSIGTGIDYWLGYDESHQNFDPNNFFQARLEISGILSETKTNSVQSRVRSKSLRTKRSDSIGIPAYISIVEFSNPKAYFAKV